MITTSLIRYHFPVISKTMHTVFRSFFIEEKVLKTYFLLVCEVCAKNSGTPCTYIIKIMDFINLRLQVNKKYK